MTALLQDKFGNYIVQRALSCMSNEKARSICVEYLIPYFNAMDEPDIERKCVEASVYKRLRSRIQQQFPDLIPEKGIISLESSIE